MAAHIKTPQVVALICQLSQITGPGGTEIARESQERELKRQRLFRRSASLVGSRFAACWNRQPCSGSPPRPCRSCWWWSTAAGYGPPSRSCCFYSMPMWCPWMQILPAALSEREQCPLACVG